jgi:hypothetical protein
MNDPVPCEPCERVIPTAATSSGSNSLVSRFTKGAPLLVSPGDTPRQCRHLAIAAVALFGAVACGGSSGAKPAVATVAAPPQVQTSPASEPVVMAPEPSDVVIVGRARKPGATLTKLGEWAGFPLPWEDFLAQRLPSLANVVRTDAPMDFAVSLDPHSKGFPDLYAVFSVALTDYDKGLAALRQSGEVIAAEDTEQVYVEVDEGVECSVARATPNPRLVCGKHVALTALGSYVATNLSQQEVGSSDVFTELRLAPIHARYGKQAQALKVFVPALLREGSLQNARFDAALAAAAHATVDDVLLLAGELDRVRVAMDLEDATQQATLHLDVRFRGSGSFIPAAVAHASTNATAAPEIFWSLPAESTSVSFSTFANPYPRLSPVVDILGELGAGALEHVGLASGAAERWLTELKTLLTAGGVSAYAHLPGTEQPAQSLASLFGVNLYGVEGDGGALQRFTEASVLVFNDKHLRAELVKRSKGELKELPTVATKGAAKALGLPTGTKVYTITVPKGWALELAKAQLSPELASKQGPFTLSAVVVRQGERTWVGWGGSEPRVAAALKTALVAPASGGLGTNPALARWRSVVANSGASLKVAQLFEPGLMGGGLVKPAEAELALRSMPGGGKSFIHVTGTTVADGPQANLQVDVPKDALADLVSAFLSLANK